MHGLFTLFANDRLRSLIFETSPPKIDRMGSVLSSLKPCGSPLTPNPEPLTPAAPLRGAA